MLLTAAPAWAQAVPPARVAVLQAEDRRAPSPGDVATIRAGARSRDAETARIGVRALGRLERPSFIPDLVPSLRHPLPEVRAEAANAIAQAAEGARASNAALPPAAAASLLARLDVEDEASVRAAICEAVARLPYRAAADVDRAEAALLDTLRQHTSVVDRLGVAKGLEALVRLHRGVRPPGDAALAQLRSFVLMPGPDPAREARVRRLALEALIAADTADAAVVDAAASDADAQVRRLAMRAAVTVADRTAVTSHAVTDPAPIVRIEALRTLRVHPDDAACAVFIGSAADEDVNVALAALDQLVACGDSAEAVDLLERAVNDVSRAGDPRAWHRNAHAIVALASAAPPRASAALGQFVGSQVPQLRLYAARAALVLNDRGALEKLAHDEDAAVADTARGGLGLPVEPLKPTRTGVPAPLNGTDLRRLAAPRARITIRGVGRVDLALFTAEAPATVLRFAALAENGYYDGVGISRVLPNAVIQTAPPNAGGSIGALRDEVGLWPHVRGAVGIATRGRDTGEGQIVIDLVDNPRFDHEITVFAQVLNGIDVVERLLEGDVIESVEILP